VGTVPGTEGSLFSPSVQKVERKRRKATVSLTVAFFNWSRGQNGRCTTVAPWTIDHRSIEHAGIQNGVAPFAIVSVALAFDRGAWLEHACKSTPLTRAEADADRIIRTQFRSTTSRNNDLHRRVAVWGGGVPGFREVCDTGLTQFDSPLADGRVGFSGATAARFVGLAEAARIEPGPNAPTIRCRRGSGRCGSEDIRTGSRLRTRETRD
jgi:hypothetical protein